MIVNRIGKSILCTGNASLSWLGLKLALLPKKIREVFPFCQFNSTSAVQLKHAVRALSLSQLRKLDEWLHELIRRADESDRKEQSSSRKQTVAEQTLDNKTYRLESIRCGKEKCKCTRGKLHGPYWYSYFSVNGRTKSEYVGKHLPAEAEDKPSMAEKREERWAYKRKNTKRCSHC